MSDDKVTLDRIEALLLGTAVGDALGLPMEGMKPLTIKRLAWVNNLKHRFIFGRGMWSDDTEHTIMLAQALLASEGDAGKFARKFAWELRWWLFGLPAGVGLATARAMIKLWLGFPPETSGVFSAGNGSAMRTSIIAAYFPDNTAKRLEFVKAHTGITHSDPKATIASLAVTEIAASLLKAKRPFSQEDVLFILRKVNGPEPKQYCEEWDKIINVMEQGWKKNASTSELLLRIGCKPGCGISGYAYHTVPAVVYTGLALEWDFKKVVTAIITAGGDTDSTAAIAGALCGAFGGTSSIPVDWIMDISEWPTGTKSLRILAKAIQYREPLRIRMYWSPALLLRNILFLATVLAHGFFRLVPCALRREK